jgi:DivIVA domain-containing protein
VSTDQTRIPPAPRSTRPQSPVEVRAATFTRTPIGRRGFDEHEVLRYLARLADEIGTRDSAIGRLMQENSKLRHAMREWQREMMGYDGVDLVAMAQQEIEEQIAQTESYSRQREEEAARLYDEILAEAYEEAEQQLGDLLSADHHDRLVRQQTMVTAVLQSLEALATQVDATRQAFGFEIDRLELFDPPEPPAAVSYLPEPHIEPHIEPHREPRLEPEPHMEPEPELEPVTRTPVTQETPVVPLPPDAPVGAAGEPAAPG